MARTSPAPSAAIARRMAAQFWGQVQTQEKVGAGIWWFSTAGHGGFIVDTDVRPELREFNSPVSRYGQYYCSEQHFAAFEEDCMAAIVEWTYPDIMEAIFHHFSQESRQTYEEYLCERKKLLRSSLQQWNAAWLTKWPNPGVKA